MHKPPLFHQLVSTPSPDSQSHSLILSHSPQAQTLQPIELADRLICQFYILPQFCNWYAYTFEVQGGEGDEEGVREFGLRCSVGVEIWISVGLGGGEREIFVYQAVERDREVGRMRLRARKRFQSTVKVNLKSGSYLFFYQRGRNKLNNIFNPNRSFEDFSPIQLQTQASSSSTSSLSSFPDFNKNTMRDKNKNTKHKLSFLCSHEIEIKDHGTLHKKDKYVQDENNFYRECPKL